MKRREPITAAARVLLFAIYGVPIAWIVLTSFMSTQDVISSQSSLFFTPVLTAYQDALDPEFGAALLQSLVISAGTTALTLLIVVPAAYALARSRGIIAMALLGVLIVFQMLPQTANVIPLFQVFHLWDLLDSTLGVIIADTMLLTPFATLLLRPFFRGVPWVLEEAASLDGAGAWRTFFNVVLPIARNGVATVGTLVFLITWGEFLYAINFFLSPGRYPLSALLAQQVSAFGINWPGLMALAVLTSLPILVLFILSYRLLREGLTVGAVK